MAAAPMKQHPLHNFPLSLKWGQTAALAPSSTNHSHRASRLPPPDSETESEQDAVTRPPPPPRVGSRSSRYPRNRGFNFSSCSSVLLKVKQRPEKRQKPTTVVFKEIVEKPTTVVLREITEQLRKQLTVSEVSKEGEVEVEAEEEEELEEKGKEEEEEGSSRPWKLRPRKGVYSGAKNGGELKEAGAVQVNEQRERENMHHQQVQPKSMRLRGLVESSAGACVLEKKEKRKFWIALAREEIEEDIFIMTGSRPARRPRKRPKNVQKVLDNIFPGLWLVGATAESYRIADVPVKK